MKKKRILCTNHILSCTLNWFLAGCCCKSYSVSFLYQSMTLPCRSQCQSNGAGLFRNGIPARSRTPGPLLVRIEIMASDNWMQFSRDGWWWLSPKCVAHVHIPTQIHLLPPTTTNKQKVDEEKEEQAQLICNSPQFLSEVRLFIDSFVPPSTSWMFSWCAHVGECNFLCIFYCFPFTIYSFNQNTHQIVYDLSFFVVDGRRSSVISGWLVVEWNVQDLKVYAMKEE